MAEAILLISEERSVSSLIDRIQSAEA